MKQGRSCLVKFPLSVIHGFHQRSLHDVVALCSDTARKWLQPCLRLNCASCACWPIPTTSRLAPAERWPASPPRSLDLRGHGDQGRARPISRRGCFSGTGHRRKGARGRVAGRGQRTRSKGSAVSRLSRWRARPGGRHAGDRERSPGTFAGSSRRSSSPSGRTARTVIRITSPSASSPRRRSCARRIRRRSWTRKRPSLIESRSVLHRLEPEEVDRLPGWR